MEYDKKNDKSEPKDIDFITFQGVEEECGVVVEGDFPFRALVVCGFVDADGVVEPVCVGHEDGVSGGLRGLDFQGGMGRRLRDLGLIPGTRIRCAFVAPSGSPMAFWIRGAVIALRRADAQNVTVCEISCGGKEQV